MNSIAKTLILLLLVFAIPALAFAEGDAEKGKAKYTQLCAQCHGPTGDGDGPVGASLPPAMKPAKLSEGKFKFATDQAKFKELLEKGGAAVGLNPLMPPQAGLSDEDVANLYAFVQSLAVK